jgi:hypothetical protein
LKRPPVVALFLSLVPASANGYALRYRRALADSAVSFTDLPTPDAISIDIKGAGFAYS